MYTALRTRVRRSDQAYHELKPRLLSGEFPLNVRLGEERLAALLDVSRTPVREALLRLHAEGLVRRGLDGGFEPTAPDVAVMRHLYEVRTGLEMLSLQRPGRAGSGHDPEVVGALHEEWLALVDDPPEPDPGFVLADEAFHLALAEAGGNPELADLLRQVNERIRVVRMQDFLTAERVQRTVVEHVGIAEAVLAGDIPGAERRFVEHIDASVAVVEERVERAIARMATGGPR